MIHFTCPSCKKALKAADEEAGRKKKCPGCGQQLTAIPPEAAESSPPQKGSGGVFSAFGRFWRSKQSSEPAKDAKETPRRQPIPRLTKEGALIKCPCCTRTVHILEDDFNKEIPCPKCKKGIMAVFSPGKIRMDCPECGLELEIAAKWEGETTHCDNCRATIQVPVGPILMRKGKKRSKIPWTLVGVVIAANAVGSLVRKQPP
jgi:DNA-directed RNA polymerase subunit M/transcription elongation factor TFIIS